ncbi:MAG: OmpA family protein [Alphaproteobacteria bacterium]|nr:OmpA family protein [Alphaproteobacteria bacterium]
MNLKITTALAAAIVLGACHTPPCDDELTQGEAGMEGTAIPGTAQDFIQHVPNQVFFEFNKSSLTSEAHHNLAKQAEWLSKYPQVGAVIEGHADKRGTREYNLALGERRAVAAKKYLEHKGIAASRLKTVSYGKDVLPAGQGDDEVTHQKNRTAITKPE